MTRATTPFLLFAFLLLAQVSTASHFRYANYNWRKVDYQKYEFYTEQGRRGDYSSYKADTGKSFPAIGDTIDLTKSSSTRLWNWGDGTTSKYIVTVNSFSPQSQQNWFIATQTINHTFPAPGVYTISFESCCRLGACSSFTPTNCLVENGNRNYRIEFTIDTRDGSPTRSPRSTAQDTIFFKKNALTSFPMPVQQSDSGNALTFALSPTSKSKLKYASPVGFSLQSDGRVSWTPTVAGLYVIQLQVTDGTNTIILDFFLEVGDECTGSSCDNRPPAFVPAAPPTYSFSFGSELVFDVIAEDPDGDDVFVTSGALPEGAVLNPCVSETGKCTRTFRWTPSLGQENVDICFNAADSTGNKFLGLYCVALVQGAADFIFVTGTVRDFTASHADFAVGNSVALNVQNALGSDGKPQYQSGGSGAANFNEWWNTDQSTPNERVFSITLSNSDTFDKRIFSFESSVFYPIDELLLGNEGGEHNKYYTYEIHSDLTYSVEGGEVYEFKSADDLFVFVNGELAVDLGGTRGAASTAVLDMDQYAAAKGLARDETYRFDLFYAHRASSHDPEVQIQMNEAVICSAISTGFNVFDASAFDAAAADKLRLLGNAAITSQRLRLAAAGVEATAAAWVGEKVGSIVEPRKQKFLNGFRATFTFELSGASTFEGFAFVLQGDSAGARGSGGGAMGYGGIAYSVAIEFDARYQQTLNDPTGHHVSMISRSLDSVPSNANSADHQYALGTSEDALDFTDGPQDVIIEYTPASDSGSGPRLGWIRVFMNDNLVPVLQVQVESSQLQNVFTGSAGYMGFTCGSSAGQGNVDITQFSLTLVPPSALRSNAASLPARIDAGATGSFTVQLRDACSKAIQTGEDGSRFTLSMTTDLALTQGRVSPPVATTLLDNGDGSYTISYSPTISGFYSVDVLFDNEPIQGSPFQVQVSALSPSTTASYFVFGMLAESYSNSPVADGLYMVVVNTDGVIVSNAGYTAATMSSFASALNAASTGFAVAISAKGNVWGAGGSPVTAAVSAIQSGLGSTTVGSLVSGNSWAIIGLKGSAPHAEQRSSSAAVSLSATIGSRKISVASAGTALGNRGYVQVEPVDTPEFTVGTVSSFTVVARDRFNNLAAGGDQFAYESEPATITKTAFGTFDFIESAGYLRAEFTTTDAGPYSIAINLGGSSLPLSPFNVLVNPGAAVASNCIASGNGLSFATAGVPESFRVQLADGFGNAITTERSQDVIAASMTHTPTISFAAAWDSVSRSYNIGYEATVRGDYNLTVTVGGDEIQSSPFLVSVAPGNVAAATSTVTAPATAIAGDSIAVTIQARDSEGNDRASPNVTPFEVTIDPALDVTLSYQGDGAYEARMVAENAGSYTITVEYLDTVIGPTQAEPTITVTAAELSVASTMPNSFADEIVGDQSFDIQATDAFGNPRTGNDDASELFVSISSLPNGAFSGDNVQIALDTNNVYTVTWRAEVAASYNVSVSLRGGEAIANSPTTILLEPAPTSAAGSTVTGPGRLGGVGDTVAHFTITARDEFGNQRSDGDDVFAVTIENRGNVTNGNIDFLSEDGVYRVNYTVPEYLFEHTNMNITVTYDGDVVFANPSATISGSTDTSHAAINESDPTVRAGDFYNVTIIDVDGSGTANTEGGKSYTAVFSGPSEVRTVNSVGVGPDSPLYTFSFVPSETGTWSFRWFWNGVIETEPSKAGVTFQVNPADIDLAQSVVRGLPATLIAGNNGSITVQFRDQFGNQIHSDNITEGSISLSLAVQSDGAAQVLETNAKADGTFEALYTSTTAGNLAVQLFEGATRIGLSSYDIVVQAASLNGPQSEIDEAPSNVAGSSSLLKLLARDVHGNSYNYGDAEFDVTIVDPEGGDPPVFTVEDIKYRGFNNYVALFEVETAGEWHVEVKIDGEHLTGSPATVVISPAAIDSATTTATAPGSVTPAGDVVQVLIETKDEFGNPSQCCVDRPRSFRATITHNTTGTVFSALVDSRSGTGNYEVNFTETTLVGVYILRLVADTVPITAAPSFTVGPGDVAAASTSFSTVDGQTPVSTFGSVSMQTRDAFGNVLDKATADDVQIQVLVSPPCPDDDDDANAADSVFGVPGSMETSSTFNGNGAYTLQFRGQSLGTYWLNVTVDGVAVPCTVAPELKIVAGAADATESTLTGAGLDEGAVGEEHRIDLTIRDAQGNEVLPETASTVVVTVGELYNGVSGPIPANWLSEANGANISVTYDNKATYTLTYVSVTATAYELVVAVDGERVPSPVSSITLGPGVVADFSLTGTSEDAVATRPGSFDVQGLDRFGNVVEVNKHDYTAEFRGKEGLGYSFVGQSSFIGSGTHRISYLSVWHGSFEVTVTLRRDDEASGSVAKIFDVTVLHVTCAARDAAQPYLCPEDDECVANVTTDCPSGAVDLCPSNMPVRCAVDNSSLLTCAEAAADCPCPADRSVRCDDLQCVVTQEECFEASPCPASAPFRCVDAGGVCRASEADCPSPHACSPGFRLCPDAVSCALTLDACASPPGTDTACPNAGEKRCRNGRCVERFEDCPALVTCPEAGMVVCPDGSCKADPTECAPVTQCFIDGVDCTDNKCLCHDGSCRADRDDCPAPPTCPVGWVLCAHGRCAQSVAACGEVTECENTKVRCPDGSCRENLQHCPTATSCPSSRPIKCSDGVCVASLDDCASPSPCGASLVTCPDGTCVAEVADCPTRPRCPVAAPVRCSSGECVVSAEECVARPRCPVNAPVLCPDGSCRGSSLGCPSSTSCPSTAPVRCLDSRCVLAAESCRSVEEMACAEGTLRCPGGECAPALDLCPTPVTCVPGTRKCQDATCRVNCTQSDTQQPLECAEGEVYCPQSTSGLSCAATIADCPLARVCPFGYVRCVDMSCAPALSQCPPTPDEYSGELVPCADGSFEVKKERCSTPVTCPSDAPYKCWDDTCRVNPNDCPEQPSCPDDQPYLCPGGLCQARLSGCRSTGSACDADTPVRCPNGDCVADVASCPETFPSDPDLFSCPHRRTLCRDGSCRARDSGGCPDLSCPEHLPHLCLDGLCTADESQCVDLSTGCVAATPVKCSDGSCVAEETECPAAVECPTEGDVRCPDGSCAVSENSCPQANGCPIGFMQCADKRCELRPVDLTRYNPCTDGESAANTCQGNAPYRCPGGMCVQSQLLCPPPLDTVDACPEATPVRCDDGSCVVSSVQCPVIYACTDAVGTERCGDGSCREEGQCPDGDTCPENHQRCPNGLCTPDGEACYSTVTGCSEDRIKCPDSSACVQSLFECSAIQTQETAPANGCPAETPLKCVNGDCVASRTECPFANGCEKASPFRCLNGTCAASTSDCTDAVCDADAPVCADGKCVTDARQCTALNGCPLASATRCANGECRTRWAAMLGTASRCDIVVTCSEQEVRCLDGTCATSLSLCRTFEPCPTLTPYRCVDGSCGQNSAACSVSSVCPSSAPVTCATGECKASVAQCAATKTGRCDYECWDGSCRESWLECALWAHRAATNEVVGNGVDLQGLVCTGNDTLCLDGSCASGPRHCPILPACPASQPMRCLDGSCANTTDASCGVDADVVECVELTHTRCPDGVCREECLGYDGCERYQCSDGSCVAQAIECEPVTAKQTIRVEEETQQLPQLCTSNCNRDKKASRVVYTVDLATEKVVTVAVDSDFSVLAELVVSSGSLVLKNAHDQDNTTLRLFPVAQSEMEQLSNPVSTTRRTEYGTAALGFARSVVSVAFACTLDDNVRQPLAVPMTFEASVDVDVVDDVCLAVALADEKRWRCVDRAVVESEVEEVPGLVNGRLSATLDQCVEGATYAFVVVPVSKPLPQEPLSSDWLEENLESVIYGTIGFGVLVVLVGYVMLRLTRYRRKYHEKRKDVEDLEEEVEDIELFGARPDEDVAMRSNPLANQVQAGVGIQGMQGELEVDETKRAEHLQRRGMIENLEEDKERLNRELERMKAELEMRKAQPVRSPVNRSGESAAEGERGFSARPKKKKQFAAARPKKRNF